MLTSELRNYRGKLGRAYILFLLVIVTAIFFTSSFAHGSVSYTYSTQMSTGRDPIRLALSHNGHIFASVPREKKVYVINKNNGSLIKTIDTVAHPLSIAVDDVNNNLYIGDYKYGSVKVVNDNPSLNLQFWLGGKETGEFGLPGDIVIGSGIAFVTDSPKHIVRAYSTANGSFLFQFGGYGTANGQMIYPTGIAFDELKREIYVSDHENGRVVVFALNANGMGVTYKRNIGGYGSGAGKMVRPQGLHIQNQRLYIADAYHSNIAVFTSAGVFTGFIGKYGTGAGRLKVPMDVLMSGTKMYIANSDNRRIEVFDVFDSLALVFSSDTLNFEAGLQEVPPAQVITVASEVEGAATAWTATTTKSFIKINPSSGTTPTAVTVSIDTAGLPAGEHEGQISFLTQNGVVYPVIVNLTLTAKTLLVSPSSINMSYTEGSGLDTRSLSIGDIGGTLNWTAKANNHWLSLSKTSGTTPDSTMALLTSTVGNFKSGTYNGSITVTSPNAIDSPFVVPVTLTVSSSRQESLQTITVNTNLANASFTITGPATYTGGGTSWSGNVVPGAYTIVFGHIPGYRKPATMSFIVNEAEEVVINVQYRAVPVSSIIAAAKGAGKYATTPVTYNDSKVKIFDKGTGELLNEFLTLATQNGASIAMGDIDGDGDSELIVTPSASTALSNSRALVRVFRTDGTLLGTTGEIKIGSTLTKNGAYVVAGDIDRDGRDEIVVSVVDTLGYAHVFVYSVNDSYQFIERARLALGKGSSLPPYMSFGDTNGNGKIELVISYKGYITTATGSLSLKSLLDVYSFNGNGGMSPSLENRIIRTAVHPVLAIDLDGDGKDEIITASNTGTAGTANRRTVIVRFKGDLTSYGSTLTVYADDRATMPILSFIDSDGDHKKEIVLNQGYHKDNDAIYRIVGSGGTVIGTANAFPGIKFGVFATSGFRRL